MPAVAFNNKRSGCYLGESNPPNQINEEILFAAAAGSYDAGLVLGQVTANEKFVPHNPAASDGSQVAAAILFHPVISTGADVKTVATRNGPATISLPYLTFATGISNANRIAAIKALRGRGMKVLPQHVGE